MFVKLRKGDEVDNDEARDYAPITMGNLCHYHWLLEYIIIFSIALILVSALNLCWSVFQRGIYDFWVGCVGGGTNFERLVLGCIEAYVCK